MISTGIIPGLIPHFRTHPYAGIDSRRLEFWGWKKDKTQSIFQVPWKLQYADDFFLGSFDRAARLGEAPLCGSAGPVGKRTGGAEELVSYHNP